MHFEMEIILCFVQDKFLVLFKTNSHLSTCNYTEPLKQIFYIFQTLLGNKYGHQPFPVKISSSEFNILKQTVTCMNFDGLDLLEEWFVVDTNAVPPEYILQVSML